MTLFDLTRELIDIPSVTGDEKEIANYLSLYLKDLKFDVHEQKVDKERINLLATSGSKPRIIFCTHLDTVPPYFSASEDTSFIYGRGACDAKGIIASMIWAAKDLKTDGIKDVGLLFVVGEETDSIGAKKANSLNVGSEFVIVGEPTENRLGIGHKGMISMSLVSRGKAAHSAYPFQGVSAIENLLDALQKIRGLDFGNDPIFGESLVNIGTIRGGEAFNIIADYACAEVSIRCAKPSQPILDKVKEVVEGKVNIEVRSRADPQKLYTVSGFEQAVLPYGTDIPHLKNFGKTLLLGPGSALVAHMRTEKIDKGQLSEAVKIYKNLAKVLLDSYKDEEKAQ